MEKQEPDYLNYEEKKKEGLHPIIIFILMSGFLIIASGIANLFGLSITYNEINANTGAIESVLVSVNSLLNFGGLQYIVSNAAQNFVTFAPLGMILIALLGIGVAEKSGFLRALFSKISNKVPPYYITFIVIFLGIMSSFTPAVGYVILVPLGALLFLINGRHPLAGMAAAFAGISVGYGLNLFVGPIDNALAISTTGAANIIDLGYEATMAGNWYFMIIATVIMTFIGMWITEKIIVPKLGLYKNNEDFNKIEITKREKRGLRFARISILISSLAFLYLIIPGFPGSGGLLDITEKYYINQLFSNNSYFAEGLVFIISVIFLVGGLSYGVGRKTIKNDKDVAKTMTSALDGIGHYMIIIFFASQFIAYFKYTNFGPIVIASVTELISKISFTGAPLIILLLIITALLNLIVTSPAIKWAIMAPVFVPMFMQLNLSPEFTQLVFRAGDSITNGITPFLAYFAIFLALAHKYDKKGETTTIKKAISIIYPYSLIFGFIWLILIIGWYLIGLPIGPGIYPTV